MTFGEPERPVAVPVTLPVTPPTKLPAVATPVILIPPAPVMPIPVGTSAPYDKEGAPVPASFAMLFTLISDI